jgi:hypothetical protein
MDPVRDIKELKQEREELKQQLKQKGISEAKEIAIRNQITALDQQLTQVWCSVRRPDEVPFTWLNFKKNAWDALPNFVGSAGVGGVAYAMTLNKRYGVGAACATYFAGIVVR